MSPAVLALSWTLSELLQDGHVVGPGLPGVQTLVEQKQEVETELKVQPETSVSPSLSPMRYQLVGRPSFMSDVSGSSLCLIDGCLQAAVHAGR